MANKTIYRKYTKSSRSNQASSLLGSDMVSLSVCLEQTRVDNQRVVVMTKWKNARLAGQISIFP
jgi:hypothetical protein